MLKTRFLDRFEEGGYVLISKSEMKSMSLEIVEAGTKDALEELYGYLLQSSRDGDVHIPASVGEKIERLL